MIHSSAVWVRDPLLYRPFVLISVCCAPSSADRLYHLLRVKSPSPQTGLYTSVVGCVLRQVQRPAAMAIFWRMDLSVAELFGYVFLDTVREPKMSASCCRSRSSSGKLKIGCRLADRIV
jgi:hypothetical protein